MTKEKFFLKKVTALFICMTIVLSNSIFSLADENIDENIEFVLGDVDNDGQITAKDSSLVLQSVLGSINLSKEQKQLARVTGNKILTVNDAVTILRKVLDGSVEFIPYEGSDEDETESSTKASTESSTVATTESSTVTSTEVIIESSTETATESSTEASTEVITESTTETATESTTESTTETATESTTESEPETPEENEPLKSLNTDDSTPEVLTSDTAIGDFTIKANSEKNVTVSTSNNTDISKNMIKLGGTGSTTYRSISFNVEGNVTIKVVTASSSTSERILVLSDGETVIEADKAISSIPETVTFNYSADSEKTLYIYSKSSGMNIYKIDVYTNNGEIETDSSTETTTENSSESETETDSNTEETTDEVVDNELSKFNLTGFGSNEISGGGEVSEDDSSYIKVSNAQEFDQALHTAIEKGTIKVIEITNDLNLGINEVTANHPDYSFQVIKKANCQASNNDILKETGVSMISLSKLKNVTIYSKNGAKIKHACFNFSNSSNIIIRNLEFDEIWEWDEGNSDDREPGAYDLNDWDYITFNSSSTDCWVDHCTFNKAYDGIIDIKDASNDIVISWCKFLGDDMSEDSWVTKQINQLEETYQKDLENGTVTNELYYHLRNDQGYTPEQIIAVQAPQKKAHLVGHSDSDKTMSQLSVTIYNCYYKEIQDRMPRLRGGNAHIFNSVIDSTNTYKAKNLNLSADGEGTNGEFHFGITNQGLISTCGGAVKGENIHMIDVYSPMSFEQKKGYPGKILVKNTKYQLHKKGSTSEFSVDLEGVNSTDGNEDFEATGKGSTQEDFSWNEGESAYIKDGELTYDYDLIDTNKLFDEVVPFTGAGVMTEWNGEWLKTTLK